VIASRTLELAIYTLFSHTRSSVGAGETLIGSSRAQLEPQVEHSWNTGQHQSRTTSSTVEAPTAPHFLSFTADRFCDRAQVPLQECDRLAAQRAGVPLGQSGAQGGDTVATSKPNPVRREL